MNVINIEGTVQTPKILFSEEEKHLIIEGRSTLENPAEFYLPLLMKLKNFKNSSTDKLKIDFKLEYFNTTSSLAILDLLKILQSLSTPNNQVVINWHYDAEDEDLLEIGEDYSAMLNFPFNLIAIPN